MSTRVNSGYAYRSTVDRASAGRGVLAHLAARFAHSTLDEWTARLARGEIEVDARPVRDDHPLRAGSTVVWHRPPWREPDVPLRFDVLYEDAAVLVVDKPSGLPTQPGGGFLEHTLWHLVQARDPSAHAVHRLGRCTSGAVIFARTPPAAARLSAAWRAHAVEKLYRGLVAGLPAWDVLDVHAPIGPVAHPRLGTVHAARSDGKPAHSHLRVLERRDDSAVTEMSITTGRPHQIRIHSAWAGHPLVGDPLYAAGGQPRPLDPGLPGDGGYLLHAWRVRFPHPDGTRMLTVEAPLPAALSTAV